MAALSYWAFIALGGLAWFGPKVDGLTCWKTYGSSFVDKMDHSEVITEKKCLDSDKSCVSEMYNVGRHWYLRLGCSAEDKMDCSEEAKGSASEHVTCHCQEDYCNSASSLNTIGLGGFVWLAMLCRFSPSY